MVMSTLWFAVALVTLSIFKVHCQNSSFGQNVRNVDGQALIDALFGFKPCLDENCENYGPSVLEPEDPVSEAEKVEKPRAHCMLLKPSAVKQFSELENAHPDIKDVKYEVLEEVIEYMHTFTSLQAKDCQPAMKLIDLVILAANSLRTQYAHQGAGECIYEKPEDNTGTPVESDKTDVPCNSDYSEDVGIPICAGKTVKPELNEPTEKQISTEKYSTDLPYVPSSTVKPELQEHTQKPYVPSSTEKPVTDIPYVPTSTSKYETSCTEGVTTEKPCTQSSATVTEEYLNAEEIIAEEDEEEVFDVQVGSLRGIPGVHFPNYTDIPITAFTCSDKHIPGFYADLEAACQVFHVCYEHRRESFLCPVGTIFNQPILACDYWYSSNCSLASYYYDVNERSELKEEKMDVEVKELLTGIAESEKKKDSESEQPLVESDLDKIAQFFPVKAIITDIKTKVKIEIEPSKNADVESLIVDKMATTKVVSDSKDTKSVPEPAYKPVEPSFIPVSKSMKIDDLLKGGLVSLVTAKLASAPVSKVTTHKTAIPIVTVVSKTKAAIPVAKAKLATKLAMPAIAKAAAVPIVAKAKVTVAAPSAVKASAMVKAKLASAAIPAAKVAISAPVLAKGKIVQTFKKVAASSIPAVKAKTIASAVPLAKTKLPLMKASAVKSPGTPLWKAKMVSLPLTKSKVAGPLSKVKLAKAAGISPLTKKALALGYMKLLKAKKFALMG